MANRLITPSQLSLFSISPVIGAWWEELHAQKLYKGNKPAVSELDQQLFADGLRHEQVLLNKLENEGHSIARRLRNHLSDPRFKALGERLEDLRKRHQQGLLISVAFLKELLDLAKELVAMENPTPKINTADEAKAALTELFEEAKSEHTPIIVERIVNDIDRIVKEVRFEGWQATHAGEREVRKALRKTLFHYKLHSDKTLFAKAYSYIEKYY